MADGECCADMVRLKEWKAQHSERHEIIDAILEKLMNRLPLWATVAGAVGGSLIGFLAAHFKP